MFTKCNIQSSEHRSRLRSRVCLTEQAVCSLFWNSMHMTWFIQFCSCGIHSRWVRVWNTACFHHVLYNTQSPDGIALHRTVRYLSTVESTAQLFTQRSPQLYPNKTGSVPTVRAYRHNRNVNQGGKKRQDAGENYILASDFVTGTLLKRLWYLNTDMIWGGHVACLREKIA